MTQYSARNNLIRSNQQQNWRWQINHPITSYRELCDFLGKPVDPVIDKDTEKAAAVYPMMLTPYYASLIEQPRFSDPVFAQSVPEIREIQQAPAATPLLDDPLSEERDSPVPGLVHRYPDRALIMTTVNCAVRCRHCMRKRQWRVGSHHQEPLPHTDSNSDLSAWQAYIREHPEIHEVILSGGDPLLLPDAELGQLLSTFSSIPHISSIRIGTRVPVVLPQRVTDSLCETLGSFAPVWVATHFNHPVELTSLAQSAVARMIRAGMPVLNQSVLLKGVNDDSDTLVNLSRALLAARIKPYALYHGDPVTGTSHFRTGIETGMQLLREMHSRIGGIGLPLFAIDLPDGGGKVPLMPDFQISDTKRANRFSAFNGGIYDYY